MDDRKKVLVVDDEAQIIRVLRHILNAHGYAVRAAEDGEAGLDVFREWQPDLVLTDLQMPNVDGLDLCRLIRKGSTVPIVVLSVRDDEKTIVQALDSGADDYVTKPFGTNELLARLRAAFRRVPERSGDVIESGEFRVDTSAHDAELNGRKLKLTPKEFDLLVCLLRNPDRVLTHTFLLRHVWGDYYTEQPEALRVLVGSLRKKIEDDPSDPRYLLTEPWIGYRFHPGLK
jgi:Response regulators consisting of a CheY-like receiver domain and a winged-helix DNA-binding domain